MSFAQNACEILAKARVTFLDYVGKHRFVPCVGEHLKQGQPTRRVVGLSQVQPLLDHCPDIDLFLIGIQQVIELVKQTLRRRRDHFFFIGKVIGHGASGAAGMTGDFAQRRPGITLLGNDFNRCSQQFTAFFQTITYRTAATWGGR